MKLGLSKFKIPSESIMYRNPGVPWSFGRIGSVLSTSCFFQRWRLGHRKMFTSSLGISRTEATHEAMLLPCWQLAHTPDQAGLFQSILLVSTLDPSGQ